MRVGAPTEHELAFAGRLLVTSRCTRCGEHIARDVRRRYVAHLVAVVTSSLSCRRSWPSAAGLDRLL